MSFDSFISFDNLSEDRQVKIHQGGFRVDRDRFWDPHLQVFIINLVIEKQLDLTAKRKGWIEGKEEGEIEGERRGIGKAHEALTQHYLQQ